MFEPYVRNWATGDSTLLYFGTGALAPPTGRSQDHMRAAPEPQGSPPRLKHGGGAQRSPGWDNLMGSNTAC